MILIKEIYKNKFFLLKQVLFFAFFFTGLLTILTFNKNMKDSLSINMQYVDQNVSYVVVNDGKEEDIENLRKKEMDIGILTSMHNIGSEAIYIILKENIQEGYCRVNPLTLIYYGINHLNWIRLSVNGTSGEFFFLRDNSVPFNVIEVQNPGVNEGSFLIFFGDRKLSYVLDDIKNLSVENDLGIIATYKTVSLLSSILSSLAVIMSFLSGVFIYTSIQALMDRRKNFIGLLRSVGFSKQRIYFIYYLVYMSSVFLSFLIGMLCQIYTRRYLNGVLNNLFIYGVSNKFNYFGPILVFILSNLVFLIIIFIHNFINRKRIIMEMGE